VVVEDVLHVTGRGWVATGTLTVTINVGDYVRRSSDGREWQVKGMETFRPLGPRNRPGDPVGLLLGQEGNFERGDVLELVCTPA
jgi:translation elongation factor EF-Tu-like GTPase